MPHDLSDDISEVLLGNGKYMIDKYIYIYRYRKPDVELLHN